MKPDFFVSSPTSKTFIQYKSHHYGLSLLRALSHGLKVVCIERVVPTKESWTFSSTPLEKLVLKTVQWNVIVMCYYHCCCCRWPYLLLGLLVLRPSISSLLPSAIAFLLKSVTSVVTKCDNFITKCDSYYKGRQNTVGTNLAQYTCCIPLKTCQIIPLPPITASSPQCPTRATFSKGTQRQFSENICSEDDLRSRIFGTFVVKFLACLPL